MLCRVPDIYFQPAPADTLHPCSSDPLAPPILQIPQHRRLEPVRQRQAAVDHDRGARDVGRYPVRQHRQRQRCKVRGLAEPAERNVSCERGIGDEPEVEGSREGDDR